MLHLRSILHLLLVLGCVQFPALAAGSGETEQLEWNQHTRRVSAHFENTAISNVIARISGATGWQAFKEPGLDLTVTTAFEDLSSGDALKRIFSRTSYAVIPGTNGYTRLLVFDTSMNEATDRVLPPRKASAILEEVIVGLKPGVNAEAWAAKYGAEVTGKLDEYNLVRLAFSSEEAANIARELFLDDPDVEGFHDNLRLDTPEPSTEMVSSAPPYPPINLNPVDTGNQLVVGLIDTAIQYGDSLPSDLFLPSINLYGETDLNSEMPMHGTSMASTFWQSLSESLGGENETSVRVLPVDVYGNHPNSSTFDVGRGILQAINQGAGIVNLSLGTHERDPWLESVIRQSSAQGVLFVVAAGNEPTTAAMSPAFMDEVISVTAANFDGTLASYANRSDTVDVIAPGTSFVHYNGQVYYVKGTSPAAAWFSGRVAADAQSSGLSPSEIGANYLRPAQTTRP